jgi:SpoVK/Ycf46/Vps4 family AAA+-type ATPase
LVRLDAGRLFGSLVGESESNLRGALKTAEAVSPCVLMVDEIEKAFGQNGGLDGGTSSRVFGGLLSWLQDKKADVFVVATANDVSRLPPELLRKGRFDEIFFVDLPNFRSRSAILGIHLRLAGHRWKTADLEESVKSSQGFTGSELEAAVQSALVEAFHANRKPGAADLVKAIRSTVPLSKTMGEKIQVLREWCKSGRAVPAGKTLEQDASRQEVSVDV